MKLNPSKELVSFVFFSLQIKPTFFLTSQLAIHANLYHPKLSLLSLGFILFSFIFVFPTNDYFKEVNSVLSNPPAIKRMTTSRNAIFLDQSDPIEGMFSFFHQTITCSIERLMGNKTSNKLHFVGKICRICLFDCLISNQNNLILLLAYNKTSHTLSK